MADHFWVRTGGHPFCGKVGCGALMTPDARRSPCHGTDSASITFLREISAERKARLPSAAPIGSASAPVTATDCVLAFSRHMDQLAKAMARSAETMRPAFEKLAAELAKIDQQLRRPAAPPSADRP